MFLSIQIFLLITSPQGISGFFRKRTKSSKLHVDENSAVPEKSETPSNSKAIIKVEKKKKLSSKSFKVNKFSFNCFNLLLFLSIKTLYFHRSFAIKSLLKCPSSIKANVIESQKVLKHHLIRTTQKRRTFLALILSKYINYQIDY